MTKRSGEADLSNAEAPQAWVTGVAAGGLGTGTNLDETQVYARDDLRADEPGTPGPPEPDMAPLERPVPVERPVALERPAVEPPRTRRRTGPLVAGAAVVLVAAGALIVGVGLGGKLGAGQPSPGASVTVGPTRTAPVPTESDKGKGKGNDKGNDNGNDNGNGPKN